jgi:bacteriorhodopsin
MDKQKTIDKQKSMDKQKLLELTKTSFYGVFYFMICALIITLLSSFIVKDPQLQRILVIEILITGISSFMYFLFTNNISKYFNAVHKEGDDIDLTVVDRLRYNGWVFTTPLMLIALCLVLSSSTKVSINPIMMFTILLLNYLMLLLGYLGEVNMMDRLSAMVLGFIPFFVIFYLIFSAFIIKSFNLFNYLIFGIYFIIWAGYGVSYIFEEKSKNILTNIFDAISKGVVAIILSLSYLTW